MDERFETRRHHYVLFRFPSSHAIENLFSHNPTSVKVSPEWVLYDYERVSASVAPGCSVQWAIALSDTKERVNLTEGHENEDEAAIRRGIERARRSRMMDIGGIEGMPE
jgi:ribosomal protein S5